MKKLLLFGLALSLFLSSTFAAPVDVNRAKELGLKYVQNTLGEKSATLSLAYTQVSEVGADALYVFNHDHGYVVVAADDRAYPILGYSEDAAFDVENIPDGLRYYLGYYARQIQYAIDNDLSADTEVAEQWYWVEKEGVIGQNRGEKSVSPLLSTVWDQGWPYNYYAPTCVSYWTNNHCYAGCVATAMSQVMKFWNWPETGVGEHSYNTSSYPGNGETLSVNFGETTYNWSIMPNQLGSQANQAALAVALLMYHCGVAVDMNYAPDGSAAHTEDVPDAVIEHFRYATCTRVDSRDSYTKEVWEDKLIASLDHGIPMVYAGSDTDGGHAFNCDGYNNQRFFHFNWGWSGSYNNTYYQIDALNTGNGSFNSYQRAVFNMIPDYIYNALVPPIETLEATTVDAMDYKVTLTFTVPTVSVTGAALESVSSIILRRNGEVINTFENPQPGEQLFFEDTVDEYGCYEYTITGVNYNLEGESYRTVGVVGPNCTWKLICTTTNFQGWSDGKVKIVGENGVVITDVTMANTSPISKKFQMPEGNFSVEWETPTSDVPALSINLKNSAGQSEYNFSGSSAQLSGTLYNGNNDCPSCTPPTDLEGEYIYDNGVLGTRLSWNCEYDPSNYKIYRSNDGVDYVEIAKIGNSQKEYFDEIGVGAYYYKVTAFSSACESTPAVSAEGHDYVYVMITSTSENAVDARVYPNPTTCDLRIECNAMQMVTVYNMMGQKVYEQNVDGDRCTINMKPFGCGMYLVRMTSANGSVIKTVSVIE